MLICYEHSSADIFGIALILLINLPPMDIKSLQRLAVKGIVQVLFTLGVFGATVYAQQYCISGPIKSLTGCDGCGFSVGDLFSLTLAVKTNGTTCAGSLTFGLCNAPAAMSAQINGIRWTNTADSTGNVTMTTRADGTTFTFAGSAFSGPVVYPIPKGAMLNSNFAIGVPGYIPDTLALPSALPAPAAVAATHVLPSLNFSLGTATGTFGYEGTNCAAVGSGPSINGGGIVPLYSPSSTIQPGSWISVFGTNLASATATWNGDFPTSLGGTSVTINNKPAYLWYVSPGQINAQAPDDNATGPVPVIVTTAAGTAASTVTLGPVSPSFSLLDGKHVAGIILRSDHSGLYGGGTYDILGPAGNSLGYQTIPARSGDTLSLFGVGFGPVNPAVPAGKPYSGSAPAINRVSVSINGVVITPSFVGLTAAGLYQINVTVPPGLGTGEVSLLASVNEVVTQNGVMLSLQ